MMNSNFINSIERQLKQFPKSKLDRGFVIDYEGDKLTSLSFKIKLKGFILPLREGEYIKDIYNLPLNKEYSLSYPGTASMKSMVLFISKKNGIFIGGRPSYEFAKIKIKRIKKNEVLITYISKNHNLFFIPFGNEWRIAANKFKSILKLSKNFKNKSSIKPKYFLQIGIKDSEGKCYIKHFKELKVLIDYFHSEIGPGHIIHFFGTNTNGFDRMFPDYFIDISLGGKRALSDLLKYAKNKGFLTSQHYNPRIADSEWIKKNPLYKRSIVKNEGNLVFELYKGHKNYFMNPNDPKWFSRCMKMVKYLKSVGFDYIQLDQFTYQRNFYAEPPLQIGYKKMLDEFRKLGIKTWLEGVSDIHKLDKDNFYQILIRDTPRLWDGGENRRGYPYGVSYPDFFMFFYPHTSVSYQIVTEKNNLNNFKRNLNIAKKIGADIYDLQMDFYTPQYMKLLKKIVKKIKKYDK